MLLVGMKRRAGEVLDPNALTIGFARRFATYKRATLLFRDVERLRRILCDKDRPVQVIVAGKAHPRDQPGKTFIREIVQLSRDPELWKRVVFVEDYDINVFYSEHDGCYVADIPELKFCSACGNTPEEAVREVQLAKAAWLQVR